jgi:L-ribulokinase
MAVVAGVDFGTLNVRVSLVDSERGLLDSAIAEYPLHRQRTDPEYATQSHEDHMRALAEATRAALRKAGVPGESVEAIALDTTGSSVIPVGQGLKTTGRILFVVRPSGEGRSRGNYRGRAPHPPGSH